MPLKRRAGEGAGVRAHATGRGWAPWAQTGTPQLAGAHQAEAEGHEVHASTPSLPAATTGRMRACTRFFKRRLLSELLPAEP